MPIHKSIVIALDKNTLMAYGIAPMAVAAAAHVRVCEIRIPAMFIEEPTVTATVYSKGSPGTMFGIYNIKVNDIKKTNETQVVVQAANVQIGKPIDFEFVCNYVVIGRQKDSRA